MGEADDPVQGVNDSLGKGILINTGRNIYQCVIVVLNINTSIANKTDRF